MSASGRESVPRLIVRDGVQLSRRRISPPPPCIKTCHPAGDQPWDGKLLCPKGHREFVCLPQAESMFKKPSRFGVWISGMV